MSRQPKDIVIPWWVPYFLSGAWVMSAIAVDGVRLKVLDTWDNFVKKS